MNDIAKVEILRKRGNLVRTNPNNNTSPRYKRIPFSVRALCKVSGVSSGKYNNAVSGLSDISEEAIDKMFMYMGYIRLVISVAGKSKSFLVKDLDREIKEL